MCLFCWKVTGATFVGVVLVGRLKRCGLNGLPVAVALPAPAALPTSAGLPAGVGLPVAAALPVSAGLPASAGLPFPFPAGLPTSVGLPASADLPTPVGLPVSVGLPTPLALPTSVGLPTPVGLPAPAGFPPGGCETCPACGPFFSFFFPFSSCCAPAVHASARLQIKTRNILMGFFLLSFWTPSCLYLFNVLSLLFGCLRWHKTQMLTLWTVTRQRCCRIASNSTIATAVARLRLRVPCIGMVRQSSMFFASKFSGNPFVSLPKTRKSPP